MVGMANFVTCPGCGAYVEDLDEPQHEYLGTVPGCWKVFSMVLEREYGEYQCPENAHRLAVDAYAMQHPGAPGPKQQQSMNVHLMSLYMGQEGSASNHAIMEARQRLVDASEELPWLDPPKSRGKRNVLDVLRATSLDAHVAAVEAWAQDVWAAWAPHHEQAAALAARYGKDA